MPSNSSTRLTETMAPLLIGAGLVVVVVAQLVAGIPVATAMTAIAWGVFLSLGMRNQGGQLAALNLVVYVTLVGFTIASQTHTAQTGMQGRVGPLATADHLLAALLMLGLVGYAIRNLLSGSLSR